MQKFCEGLSTMTQCFSNAAQMMTLPLRGDAFFRFHDNVGNVINEAA